MLWSVCSITMMLMRIMTYHADRSRLEREHRTRSPEADSFSRSGDPMAPDIERKLAAILSADAVGYSRLMAEDGPTADATSTSFGPHSSNATYSAESTPFGLSARMSGRWWTNRRVTARPAIRWPGTSGRAPCMYVCGQSWTHSPSIRVGVGISLSWASCSSVTLWVGDVSGVSRANLGALCVADGELRVMAWYRVASVVTSGGFYMTERGWVPVGGGLMACRGRAWGDS